MHTSDIKNKWILSTGLTLWKHTTHLWGLFSPRTRNCSGKLLKHRGIFAFLSFPWFCWTNIRNCENTMPLYWLEAAWGYRWGKANTCLLPTPLRCNKHSQWPERQRLKARLYLLRLTLAIASHCPPFRTELLFGFFWKQIIEIHELDVRWSENSYAKTNELFLLDGRHQSIMRCANFSACE